MRHIQIENGLKLRFPARSEDFDQGVEIGILAVLMTSAQTGFTQRISATNLEQARSLAEKMGFHLIVASSNADWTEIILRSGRARPKLTLVHSRA
jgi:hypothetical protein